MSDIGIVGKLDGAGQKFFYIQDHLSSVRVVLNQSGSVDSWTDYYPFGKVSRKGNSANEPKEGYTGYQHDVEMDLDYAGARFYNAAIGRFISVDPLASAFPSWTSYNYAYNNPINLFDPTGLAADSPGVKQPIFTDPYSDDDIESQEPGNPGDMPIFNPELDDQNENNTSESEVETDTPSSEEGGKKKKKKRIELKPYTEEQINEALSWWGPAAVTKAPKVAKAAVKLWPMVKALFGGVETYNFKAHALYRMVEKGISMNQAMNALKIGERFNYFHDGVWKVGFYHADSGIFVGTLRNRIMTVVNKVDQNYINNLKALKP